MDRFTNLSRSLTSSSTSSTAMIFPVWSPLSPGRGLSGTPSDHFLQSSASSASATIGALWPVRARKTCREIFCMNSLWPEADVKPSCRRTA